MLKRLFDVGVSAAALVLLSPLLAVIALAIWLQDFHSPLYIADRIGRGGAPFRMVKLRSMLVGADRTGVDSTSADDRRITTIGRFIRACKVDELSQLWNVLVGDMSLVGPRPNVPRDVGLFTPVEQDILSVRPGITDISSIVFADEGAILTGAADPDIAYNQLIRPWKSRLALLYVRHASLRLDVELLMLTATALVSRAAALRGVQRILQRLGAEDETRVVARRDRPLVPAAPPGSLAIVTRRA